MVDSPTAGVRSRVTRKQSGLSNLVNAFGATFRSNKNGDSQSTTTGETVTIKQKNQFSLREDGMKTREVHFFGMQANPVVTLFSQAIIWALIIMAIVYPETLFVNAANAKKEITLNFTWLYIGAQNIWVLFIAWVWINPKFANIKLGNHNEEPEFSTESWFMMMFMSAGAGTGLIYYGVGEPIYHLSFNRYVASGVMSYNDLSQQAMHLTYYHWGIHAWMCYTIVAIIQGIVHHRMGLPLSFRSCFFPIFGAKIHGWFGDLVDILSLVSTVFGICTTMGIGAMQLNTGLNRLNSGIERSILVQVFLIAIMTIIGGISAHAGLRAGVRTLSVTAFLIVTLVMFMVLIVDETTFLLNFIIQSIGHHLQWFIQLGAHTDAFEQLDGGVDNRAGPQVWMDWWTVFYWGWWVSWSPFVGLFIAKISKGRTVREIINASLTGPVLYNFLWFGIFGGAGLRMERSAIIDGCLGSCSVTRAGRQFFRKYCDSTSTLSAEAMEARKVAFLLRRPEGCGSIVQLSTIDLDEMWFELMDQYENVGSFLVVISIISMVLFFITTNDSGAIILDLLGTSGKQDCSPVQKQLWSLTLGATSIALLIAGGSRSITAIQTALNAIGLPMTVLVTILCTSLTAACEMENHPSTNRALSVYEGRFDDLLNHDNGFEFWNTSIIGGTFDIVEFMFTLGYHPFPAGKHWLDLFLAMVAPWYYLGKAQALCSELETGTPVNVFSRSKTLEVRKAQAVMVSSGICFYAALVLVCLETSRKNMWVIGFAMYFIFACIVVAVRSDVRSHSKIYGDLFRDMLASFLAYHLCIIQVWKEVQIRDLELTEAKKNSGSGHSEPQGMAEDMPK